MLSMSFDGTLDLLAQIEKNICWNLPYFQLIRWKIICISSRKNWKIQSFSKKKCWKCSFYINGHHVGSLVDIFPAQIYRADLNSIAFFLLSLVANHSLSETYISSFQSFQILCYSFPVFYFLSFSSVFLSISSTFSFTFCLFLYLPSAFFLAAFYLSPLSFFVYHLILLSTSISFFVFYVPSWLYSIFILCLSSVVFPLFFSLSFCAFVYYYYHYYYQHFYPPVLLFCIFYLLIFCLPFLLIFLLFSFSFIFLFCPFFHSLSLSCANPAL